MQTTTLPAIRAISAIDSGSPKPRKDSAISDLTNISSAMSCSPTTGTKLPSFMDNHIFTQIRRKIGHKTMVIGHRGGFLDGPENSMRAFRAAISHKLDGVEFDVWLSKDNVPMILHGGNQGELTLYGMPTEYVYEWTAEELQTKIDIGEGERIPTLQDLITLFKDSEMLLNIELKGPSDPAFKPRYDFNAAAKIVDEMIMTNGIAHLVMISSFQADIRQAVHQVTGEQRPYMVHRLTEDHAAHDKEWWTQDTVLQEGTEGVNMYYPFLNKDVVRQVQPTGGFLGVWYSARLQTEDEQMYEQVMVINRADILYSDKPLAAIAYRDKISVMTQATCVKPELEQKPHAFSFNSAALSSRSGSGSEHETTSI